MSRIATMTVIRGSGECRAYMNGVVQEEIRRQQEQLRAEHAAEAERAKTVEASRGRLLTDRMAEMNRKLARCASLRERLLEPVVQSWAMLWATVVCWGETLGFWEWVGEEG